MEDMQISYRASLMKGLGWIGLFRIAAKLIVFMKIILAYRYLSPRDVGVYGLCMIALGLLEQLTETGVNVIIVKEARPLSYFIDTAFIVSIGRGILISLALLASAFFLPAFFNDPLLFPLLLLVAIIPFIKGFINPAVAQYQKDLKFEKDSLLRLFPIFTDVMFSLFFVYLYRTPAALLLGMIVSSFLEVLVSFLIIRPLPKLFVFKKDVFYAIVNPGKWVNIAGIITFAEQNFDNVIVGKMLGSSQLGYYQTAFNLSRSFIAEIGLTFSQVLLPIYGRMGVEPERLKSAVKRVFLPAALIMIVPIIALNIPFVQELLLVFLKDKWRPMIPLLPYLSVAAWFTGMNLLFNPLYLVKAKYKSLVALYGTNLIALLILLALMIPQGGILAAAKAVLISRLLMQPFFIWRTWQITGEATNGQEKR